MHQDVIFLDDRLTYLEQNFNAMDEKTKALSSGMDKFKKEGNEKDQDIRNKYADLSVIRNRLREEIQVLTGSLEEIEHQLNRHLESVEDSKNSEEEKLGQVDENVTSNTGRIIRMEKYLDLESYVKKESKSMAVKGKSRKGLSEDKLYTTAKKAFDKGDLDKSRQSFRALLKKYPKSKNADNAQFWIGETYFREKWYEKAILEYQEVVDKYPKGNKVPAALLKQGMAFHKIGETANALRWFNELIEKFPKSNEANIAGKKIKSFK
jgi:tol-pal system protein YbgF